VARYLVQGTDVWLNTPRRPNEASGTSGMKLLANGGLNLSILDGWWDEAYDREVGWAIGNGEEYGNPEYQTRWSRRRSTTSWKTTWCRSSTTAMRRGSRAAGWPR